MNQDTRIRIKKTYLEIGNHRALVPNKQGETGLVFRKETIAKAVDNYKLLIEQAPYYRVMLDSHIPLNTATHGDVAGLLSDVWVDSDGAARVDYVVFNNTPVYDRTIIMAGLGGKGCISLSTRGFGEHVTIRPSLTSKEGRSPVMLKDSPVKYFKVLGRTESRSSGVYLENFILLGWDIVVAPSQNDASSLIFLPNTNSPNSTGVVRESAGNIRKAFGDISTLRHTLVDHPATATGNRLGNPVDPLRHYMIDGGEASYDDARTKYVSRLVSRWI